MKLLISLLFALSAVGCGTEPQGQSMLNDDATTSKTLTVDEGTFKLYENADVVPEAFCDLHVLLTLKNNGNGSVAIFENALEGVCEIAVTPDQRTYALSEVDGECGSRVFEGKLINKMKNVASEVVITDHRSRVCKDIVPANIIVEKKFSEFLSETLYSADNGISTLVSLEGTLTRMNAVGGESTGYALILEDGTLVEIELDADLLPIFVEEQKVSIVGKYKTVRGVEIPVRQVLVVKTMTAI